MTQDIEHFSYTPACLPDVINIPTYPPTYPSGRVVRRALYMSRYL